MAEEENIVKTEPGQTGHAEFGTGDAGVVPENPNKQPDKDPPEENQNLFEAKSDDASAIEKNFSIDFDAPIREFSTEFARAYAAQERKFIIKDVTEKRQMYALVFNKAFPARIDLINYLHGMDNPDTNMLNVIACGIIKTKKDGELYAAIIEKPVDRKIEDIFINNPVPEKYLTQNIILPLSNALFKFASRGFTHGKVNPKNIYFNPVKEKVYLGDCLSEPCGFSQLSLYEPLERAYCHKLGKGDHNISSDYYALGVLIIFLMTGKIPLQGMGDEKVIEMKFSKGSFAAYTEGLQIPNVFAELLRGLLSDKPEKRWRHDEIENWVKRKANPSASTPLKETMRGFIFNDVEYFTRRSLAHAFDINRAKVKTTLKPADLSRWIKHSVLKPELAESLDSMSFNNRLGENMVLEDNDISRIAMLLDQDSPIRFNGLSISIYGLGDYLAYGYAKDKREMIQEIGDISNSGTIQFWVDLAETPDDEVDPRLAYLQWHTKKVIRAIRNPGLGFGMERALYEMNPTLPCQSTLFTGHYVSSLTDLLHVLDDMADEKSEKLDPVDRHIAAYIAAKIDLRDEINLRKLSEFPNLARHPQIIMLAFLVAAQQTSRVKNVKKLTAWMAERLTIPLGTLHGKTLKDETIKNMKKISREGKLQSLFNFVTDPAYIKKDAFSFKEASAQYAALADRIALLSQQDNTEKMAYEYGLRISVTISYVILTGTLIYLLSNI